jgi:hypothetical protein
MNPGFPADFSDEPDDSEYVAQGIIEIEEKRLGRKLTTQAHWALEGVQESSNINILHRSVESQSLSKRL